MKNKVIMFPDWRGENPYQELLADGLKKNGFESVFLNFNKNKYLPINSALKNVNKPDIVHIHWINEYIEPIFWSSNYFILYLRYFLIFFDLLLLRLKNIKIVWTVHNLVSHESLNKKKELFARKLFARMCNVVVHSEGAKDVVSTKYKILANKITVIPHGNYINCYHQNNSITQSLKNSFDIHPGNHVFLFLGSIRRYKGVNELVNAFIATTNPNFMLIIAGKPYDDADSNWLKQHASKDSRIKLSLGYIPDNEIRSFLTLSSIIVLPFVSTLTSGSAILAMSYGKPLILPEKGKIFSFPDNGILYYSEEDGVGSALKKSINRDLVTMGEFNQIYSKQIDWKIVTHKLIQDVYS